MYDKSYIVKFDWRSIQLPESITFKNLLLDFEKKIRVFQKKFEDEAPEDVVDVLDSSHISDLFWDGQSMLDSIFERLNFLKIVEDPRIFTGFYYFLKFTENFLNLLDDVKKSRLCKEFADFPGFKKPFEKALQPLEDRARTIKMRLKDSCRCLEKLEEMEDEFLTEHELFKDIQKFNHDKNYLIKEAKWYLLGIDRDSIIKDFESYAAAVEENIIQFLIDPVPLPKNPNPISNENYSSLYLEAI